MYIGFISIDKPERWYSYHTLDHTDDVYHTPFFKTKYEADLFIKKVTKHYYDSGEKWYIKSVVVQCDEENEEEVKTLYDMMRSRSEFKFK